MIILIALGPPLKGPHPVFQFFRIPPTPFLGLLSSFADPFVTICPLHQSLYYVGIEFRWPLVSVLDLPELRISLLRLAPHDLELLPCKTLHGYLDRLGSSSERVLA
jgi:hypothetical protein